MFGITLQDYERTGLVACCHRWSASLPDNEQNALVAAILDVFYKWKRRQADAKGLVKIVSGGGLLSYPMTDSLVPVGDLEPWQCAGPFVKNDIDLAFKLWVENDQDFAHLLRSHPLAQVLSIIGLYSSREAAPASLINLNGFLVRELVYEALRSDAELNTKNLKKHESISKARAASKEIRTSKATELHRSIRAAAIDYLIARPTATNGELIPFLREHGFEKYKPTTIERLIAGVHGEVSQRMKSADRQRTDLYATDHRSKAHLRDRPQK